MPRGKSGTVDGVGGGRRAAPTDDALWLMKIVRRAWSLFALERRGELRGREAAARAA